MCELINVDSWENIVAMDKMCKDMRRKPSRDPSEEFIRLICFLYNDFYDDREEDSRPGGERWVPGQKALHTSLEVFRRELREVYEIEMSTAKIRKILITGGLWTTERSREVAELYERYGSVNQVAEELGLSTGLVTTYLPYRRTVYDLKRKSGNARRIDRWRKKRSNNI